MAKEQEAQPITPQNNGKTEFRDIPVDITEALSSHLEWVQTNGKSGQQADLQGYNLSRLNLQEVTLSQANLQETYLGKADLRDADLAGADLRNADLSEIKLAGANLRGADLTGVRNLLGQQLARTNLTKAKLPEDVGKFEDLTNLAAASRNTAQIFVSMLAACVVSWLTVATTTDVGLLTNTATSPLPVIGTALPILGFYVASPLLLLAIYIYFHINCARLWEGLAALPAIFPDGRRLDQVAYPWLLNGLVCHFCSRLHRILRPFSWTQFFLTIMLGWFFVPFTLILIWLRYLTRQDRIVTSVMIFLLAIAIWFGLRSFFLASRLLKGEDFRSRWTDFGCVSASVILTICLIMFSFGSIYGVPLGKPIEGPMAGLRRAVPVILQSLPFSFGSFAKLAGTDFSTRPANWSGEEKDFGKVTGAVLPGRRFHYAFAPRIFLVKADLRGAKFGGADLINADLRQAEFISANLRNANLSGANLEKTNLEGAILQDAIIEKANLKEAKLQRANLQGANLWSANLQKVQLEEAELQGVKLQKADLQDANLKQAKLQKAEMEEANLQNANFEKADLSSADLRSAKFSGATFEGATVQGADLRVVDLRRTKFGYANLQDAQLPSANLQGVDLCSANLQGANLNDAILEQAGLLHAVLKKANLYNANLQDANLNSAEIQEADLTEANLRGAHLYSAKLENATLVRTIIEKGILFQANLKNARLNEANLRDAVLDGAELNGADLWGADLLGAKLLRTDLRGVDLTGTLNLTHEQIAVAIIDETTKLPPYLQPSGQKKVETP